MSKGFLKDRRILIAEYKYKILFPNVLIKFQGFLNENKISQEGLISM